MGCLLLASLVVGAVAVHPPFEAFKAQFGKIYPASEEAQRLANFKSSVNTISLHNADPMRTWTMGINQFSDLSDAEFEAKVLMSPQKCSATNGVSAPGSPADLPAAMDWREKGVVSEVKNQGHCGSCWTFSTVGCLEAHMAIKYQNWMAPRLSEQQLVDCAGAFDTAGCNGGLPSHAFEYIKYAGGLSTEFNYPYKAVNQACKFNKSATPESHPFKPSSAGVGVEVPGGSVNITAGDEQSLKYYLATAGPVSIAFQVASDFRHYASGVYSSKVCKNGAMDVNHAVLAVGYGTDPRTNMPYWTIKNSWDYSWGHDGFFKMEAFKNMCGVANCNSFPDLYGSGSYSKAVLV